MAWSALKNPSAPPHVCPLPRNPTLHIPGQSRKVTGQSILTEKPIPQGFHFLKISLINPEMEKMSSSFLCAEVKTEIYFLETTDLLETRPVSLKSPDVSFLY